MRNLNKRLAVHHIRHKSGGFLPAVAGHWEITYIHTDVASSRAAAVMMLAAPVFARQNGAPFGFKAMGRDTQIVGGIILITAHLSVSQPWHLFLYILVDSLL